MQQNKYDANNKLIDQIVNEKDENKKLDLIDRIINDNSIDISSSGYASQLFSIFNNIK